MGRNGSNLWFTFVILEELLVDGADIECLGYGVGSCFFSFSFLSLGMKLGFFDFDEFFRVFYFSQLLNMISLHSSR